MGNHCIEASTYSARARVYSTLRAEQIPRGQSTEKPERWKNQPLSKRDRSFIADRSSALCH